MVQILHLNDYKFIVVKPRGKVTNKSYDFELGCRHIKISIVPCRTGIVRSVECRPVWYNAAWSHNRCQFQAPPMPAYRYVEENGLAAKLAVKISVDVTLEMNLNEHVTHTPPPSANKTTHSGEETSPKVHNRAISGPQTGLQFIF